VEDHFAYSWEHFVDMSLRWRDLPTPTIAQVHGWCIFGGWLVASAMDMIVASDDARFMTALLQYFPLPFDVGPRKAKELLFDNRIIEAAEAADLGFVNKVVPRADLEAETTALAERIAENPAFYLRMVKLSVNQAQDAMGFRTAVQGAHAHYMLSQLSNSQFRRRQQREGALPPDEPIEPVKRMPLVGKLLRAKQHDEAERAKQQDQAEREEQE
jgi:enoyl-CoA hydratase